MADRKKHFCTCGDLECPCNPNNPSNLAKDSFGCDACVRKNLELGEVPTCIFAKLGDTTGWDDWSVEGFAEFVRLHPRSDEVRAATAAKSAAFEAAHKSAGTGD
jgi:hypothetical protein